MERNKSTRENHLTHPPVELGLSWLVKMQKKSSGDGSGGVGFRGGGSSRGGGVRVDVNKEFKFLWKCKKMQKKKLGVGVSGPAGDGGSRGGVGR